MSDTLQEFPNVEDAVVQRAIEKALNALTDSGTPQRMAEFYNPETNYAGATFAGLQPNKADELTAVDLLATATLSVDIPVRAIRRLLEDKTVAQELTDRLNNLPSTPLEQTPASGFSEMEAFYLYVKETLARANTKTSNPWVTASKLVARKRPDLFPVRDRVVCNYLEILKLRDATKDWYVFRALMNDESIQHELRALPQKVQTIAGDAPLKLDQEPLRILDAALWRFAR